MIRQAFTRLQRGRRIKPLSLGPFGQRRSAAQLVGWHALDEGHEHTSKPPPRDVLQAVGNSRVKIVYFIRHGQSAANAERQRMQEEGVHGNPEIIDPHLTDLGRQQATALQERVAAWGVKRVLVSPLSRTIQTASLAFQHEHHIPMEVCVDAIEYFPWLKESVGRDAIDLATCDGIQSLHRAQDIVLSSLEPGWWTVAGDVARLERLRGIIARLPADVDRVAVVSHWGLINLMHDDDPTPNDPVWEEMPFARLPNTGVVRLARKVSFLNDPQ